MSEQRRIRLNYLQTLRAFAAVTVFVGHLFHEMTLISDYHLFRKLSDLPTGVGVDVFFLISGMIMLHTGQNSFGVKEAPKEFMLKRLLRIVPNYWIFTSLIVAVSLILPATLDTAKFEFWHALQSYLFIPHFDPNRPASISPILSLGWTLNYEMFFYFIFAISLYFPKRVGVLVVFSSISTLCLMSNLFSNQSAFGLFFANTVILEFLAGMAVYHILHHGNVKRLHLNVIALIVISVWVASYFIGLWEYRFISYGLPAILILTVVFRIYPEESGSLALVEKIGDASYALYLAHPFIITALKIAVFKFMAPVGFSIFLYFVSTVFITITFSVVYYEYVERSISSALQKFVSENKSGRSPRKVKT